MYVVFLSPHLPPPTYLDCARLRDAGATVRGLADAPYDQLRPELRSVLTGYYRVPDLRDAAPIAAGPSRRYRSIVWVCDSPGHPVRAGPSVVPLVAAAAR